MDGVFGVGLPEFFVILVVAVLVLKPHQIRAIARFLGQGVAQVQGIMADFRRQLNAELSALDDEELQGALQDLDHLKGEMDKMRQEVRQLSQDLIRDSREAAAAAQREFKPVSRPAPATTDDEPLALPEPEAIPGDPEI